MRPLLHTHSRIIQMMKKLLSFVALSATLISPALADDFVPLQYYEANPLPTTKTLPTFPQKERISSNTMGVRGLYGRTTIDDAIFQAIHKRNLDELELLLEIDGAFPLGVISSVIFVLQGNNVDEALKILEQEDTQSRNWIMEWEQWYAHNADDDYEWCYHQCKHYLDLDPANQGSPYRKCFRQCLGRL